MKKRYAAKCQTLCNEYISDGLLLKHHMIDARPALFS